LETTDKPANADVDFMSMLAHQLTTPLATMRWYAELLRMAKMTKPLEPAQDDMVREILLGATRMNDLIEGIHTISRLEQGKFTDEPGAVSMVEVVGAVQAHFQADITAKKLAYSVEASQPPAVTARPSVVSLIIEKLLGNAVRYTPEGGTVTVTLRQASAQEMTRATVQTGEGVLLSVADTGCGIPQDQHDKVFSKFFRADNVGGPAEGTGLGLAAAATAVAKLGGAIWFESEVDKGTTFFVVLPTAAQN
jgi:signal transduction histidine kinase